MSNSCPGRLMAASALLLLVLTPVRAADPPGILWDTTSQMVMEGMPFSPPPQSLKLCTQKVWTKPPPGGDQSCVTSNFQVVGNKATWTMKCEGDMPMTGNGEITFDGTDSYTGVIKATAQGATMTIKLSGKKIGTCDNPLG